MAKVKEIEMICSKMGYDITVYDQIGTQSPRVFIPKNIQDKFDSEVVGQVLFGEKYDYVITKTKSADNDDFYAVTTI